MNTTKEFIYMMRFVLLLVASFFFIIVNAQVTIEEIKLIPESEFHKSKNATVIYPVINSKNKQADQKINQIIISEVAGYDSTKNTRETLMLLIEEGLRSLDYKITLESKELLSLKINGLGCGAHCSSWQYNFNFNLDNGDLITIEDVIAKSEMDNFTRKLSKDKLKALKKHQHEMDSLLSKKAIDSTTYQFVNDYINSNCIDESNPENFLLSKEGIEIFDACEFPNVAKAFEPEIDIKYYYRDIKKVIDPDFFIYLPSTLRRSSESQLQSH